MKRYLLLLLLVGCVQPYVPPDDEDETDPVVIVDPVVPDGDYRMLILEETDEHRNWPQSQLNIRTSTRLQDWRNANNVQWRMWDDDIETVNPNSDFARMLDDFKKSHDTDGDTRWIMIEHGSKRASQALPKTVDELIQLGEQYK